MKKRTGPILVVVFVLATGLLVLAPYLLHKQKVASPETISASHEEPVKMPVKQPNQSISIKPVTVSKSGAPVALTETKPLPKDNESDAKVSEREPVKTVSQNPNPVIKKRMQIKPKINGDRPSNLKNIQPAEVVKTTLPKQNQKTESTTQGIAESPKEPSAWGVIVMATHTGVDAGVSYRLLQIPLFDETDLDLMVGTKQAGVGLSKYVYKNFALGLNGTVTYGSGEKNVGIYGKYAF